MKKFLTILSFMGILTSSRATLLPDQPDSVRLYSPELGRTIEVFLYDLAGDAKQAPVVYITDGKKWMEKGLTRQLKTLTLEDRIRPARYVLISTIDSETQKDHREAYFFCNPAYLSFFEKTLIPTIENKYLGSVTPDQRSLIGMSFGGLNGAYFSVQSASFNNYALLSPITYPCPDLTSKLMFSQAHGLRLFLSTGKHDAEAYLDPMLRIYQNQDHVIKVLRTEGGHDFDNWNGQVETILKFLNP